MQKTLNRFMKDLKIKTIIGLDFETYFDARYTLKAQAGDKLSTSEYVRDSRFKAQCVGIQTNRQRRARWYRPNAIDRTLQSIDWSSSAVLAHHAQFDGLILSHHYGIVPKFYFCTMSMARAWHSHDIGAGLDEVAKLRGFGGKRKADALEATKGIRDLPPELLQPLGDYCADDVQDMWGIFRQFIDEGYPFKELKLIDLTVAAFAAPTLQVDKKRCEAELQREITYREQLFKKTKRILKTKDIEASKKVLSSSSQFAEALTAEGVDVLYKQGKERLIPAFAKTDLWFQSLDNHKKASVRTLYKARLAAKSTIGETRAARLLSHSLPALPIYINYCRAHTMRWSGGDKLNPQNFTRGGELRRCIIASKGNVLVAVDSSQIEDRLNCWVAGQNDVLELYREGADPYAHMATQIYDFEVDKKEHPHERLVGKVARLGLGYQCGPPKFCMICETGAMGPPVAMPQEQGERVVSAFRTNNQRIVALWKFGQNMLEYMIDGKEYSFQPDNADQPIMTFHPEGIDMPNGLTMWYPDLQCGYNEQFGRYDDFDYQSGKRTRAHLYGGKLVENWNQCLARIVVGEQMLEIAERYPVRMMSHDEVVFEVPYRERIKALQFGIDALSKAPAWCASLPVAAEGDWAKEYPK